MALIMLKFLTRLDQVSSVTQGIVSPYIFAISIFGMAYNSRKKFS